MSEHNSTFNNKFNNNIIPDKFKQQIIDDVILPHFKAKITYAMKTETCWSTTSSVCWVLSSIVLILAAIFAFASSTYPNLPMSFLAGIFIVIGGGFKDFSTFSTNRDHFKTKEINDILNNININFSINDPITMNTDILDEKEDESERKNLKLINLEESKV